MTARQRVPIAHSIELGATNISYDVTFILMPQSWLCVSKPRRGESSSGRIDTIESFVALLWRSGFVVA